MNQASPNIQLPELTPENRTFIKNFFLKFLLKTEAVSYFIMVPVIVFVLWLNIDFNAGAVAHLLHYHDNSFSRIPGHDPHQQQDRRDAHYLVFQSAAGGGRRHARGSMTAAFRRFMMLPVPAQHRGLFQVDCRPRHGHRAVHDYPGPHETADLAHVDYYVPRRLSPASCFTFSSPRSSPSRCTAWACSRSGRRGRLTSE